MATLPLQFLTSFCTSSSPATFRPEMLLDCRFAIINLSSNRNRVQCSGLIEAGCGPDGDTGIAELDAADDMDVREGVEVEVDDMDETGREECDSPRLGPLGYSAGISSTSIESMLSRFELKMLACHVSGCFEPALKD